MAINRLRIQNPRNGGTNVFGRASMAAAGIHQTLNAKRDLHVTARHMNGFVSLLNTKSTTRSGSLNRMEPSANARFDLDITDPI